MKLKTWGGLELKDGSRIFALVSHAALVFQNRQAEANSKRIE
jgi:hypothetical protein